MRKILVAAMVLGMLAMAGAAWAADTATVNVNAVVTGTCQFLTDGSIDFALDPSSGAGGPAVDVVGTVTQPTFWCTKNATWSITDDNGGNEIGTTHNMKHTTEPDLIPYSFTYATSGIGAGRTTPITMNISSTVLGPDYEDKSAGDYSDTVTLTVNP
jgi:spore coat protein U-like protein